MFDLIFCGFNLTCQFDNVKYYFNGPKYPQEVYEICSYYENEKMTLPDYCKIEIKQPRKRNEF